MAEHQRIMDGLLADHENRITKRSIAKLMPAELRAELEVRKCSLSGEILTLQDRLLRAVMREDERHRNEVPWYAWNELGAEGEEPQEGFLLSRTKKRIKRVDKSRMVTRGS